MLVLQFSVEAFMYPLSHGLPGLMLRLAKSVNEISSSSFSNPNPDTTSLPNYS